MAEKDYFTAEIKLFQAFGMGRSIHHLAPLQLLKWAMEKAFLEDMKGPHVDALRRGIKHMDSGGHRDKEYQEKILF